MLILGHHWTYGKHLQAVLLDQHCWTSEGANWINRKLIPLAHLKRLQAVMSDVGWTHRVLIDTVRPMESVCTQSCWTKTVGSLKVCIGPTES